MDRYEKLDNIGHGGQGRVYRARDTVSGEIVALKIINASATRQPEYAKNVEREARLAMSLKHANVVEVLETGVQDDEPFIAMELATGSLADRLKSEGRIPYSEATDIAIQICHGLAHAHGTMIHRDLKPGNILFSSDGKPMICDFGIARDLDGSKAYQTNAGFGTDKYISPEQWESKSIGRPADIYSLGITLYEMIRGSVPFAGPDFFRQHLEADVPPYPKQLGVPEALEAVVRKALSKDPKDRFSDAVAMAVALTTALATPNVSVAGSAGTTPKRSQSAGTKPDVAKPARPRSAIPLSVSTPKRTVYAQTQTPTKKQRSNDAWDVTIGLGMFTAAAILISCLLDVFTGSSGWSNLDWAHWPLMLWGGVMCLLLWPKGEPEILPCLVGSLFTLGPVVLVCAYWVNWGA